MPLQQYILITNYTSQTFTLRIPDLNFSRSGQIKGNGSKYSILLPYRSDRNVEVELLNPNGQLLTFTLNVNGEISRTDPGLKMTNVSNGLLGSQSWQASSPQVDGFTSTSLLIGQYVNK